MRPGVGRMPDTEVVAMCTADLSPTTSVVPVPEGLDTSGPVVVVVGDQEWELPAWP